MKYFAIFLAFLMTIATHAWSNEVTTLQKQLKVLGYNPGSPDGLWGGLTKEALENFLSDQGQEYDGRLDNNEFQLVENELKKLKPAFKFQDINSSTERYLRTKLLCQIATVDKLKPFPTGIDDFRSAPEMSTYADLFGDGTIEFITGSWDSTIVLDTQKFPNQGNKERATKPSDYLIYSPVKDFNLGLSLKFHNARILTSDFNGDGAHDLVFVQQGRDFAPFQRKSNYILLSSNDGYQLNKLPGKLAPYHSGTTGDIDNDGDVDIVIVPGFENRIIAYINDGFGNFNFREIAQTKSKSWDDNPRYYFAGLWDFDEDDFLDLILGSQLDNTKIIWGNGTASFQGPTTFLGNNDDFFMDFEFKDFDRDGKKELITFGGNYDGIKGKSKQDNPYYHGWHIQRFHFDKRKISSIETIEKVRNKSNLFLERFSACDIQSDGDFDLVYERNHQFYRTLMMDPQFDFRTITRVIWFNKKGTFKRVRIEDPNYYKTYEEQKRAAVIKHASNLGTTALRYFPSQQYYEYSGSGNYIHKYRRPLAKPFLDKAH